MNAKEGEKKEKKGSWGHRQSSQASAVFFSFRFYSLLVPRRRQLRDVGVFISVVKALK